MILKSLFCPKFHCELNPIEGLWCYMKNFIRKYTDQSFEQLQELTNQSLVNFKDPGYNFKLWRRFWRLLALYKEGKTYEEVLQSLFSKNSQGTAKYHLKVTNSLLDKN